jgi:hypothetical protein
MPLVAKRQRAIEKLFPGFRANIDQIGGGKSFQGRSRFRDAPQILANDSRNDLADPSKQSASAMIDKLSLVEALISAASAQSGDVRNITHAEMLLLG